MQRGNKNLKIQSGSSSICIALFDTTAVKRIRSCVAIFILDVVYWLLRGSFRCFLFLSFYLNWYDFGKEITLDTFKVTERLKAFLHDKSSYQEYTLTPLVKETTFTKTRVSQMLLNPLCTFHLIIFNKCTTFNSRSVIITVPVPIVMYTCYCFQLIEKNEMK